MLDIEGLHKSFGDKEILKGISIKVDDGEIYGFIGPNGAGKTTTIRCLVGILSFENGTILIDGKDIRKDPIGCKSCLAYIPDNPDLYENLTGVQYLNFISDIFHIDNQVRTKKMEELGKELEIYDSLGDPISALSHGMKQKVAIIGALIHQPRLLVLDEPFVGLDPKASFTLKQKMKELTSQGSSIFFSSHVLEVVEKLCDHIAIIKEGEIIQSGETDQILAGGKTLEDFFLELAK